MRKLAYDIHKIPANAYDNNVTLGLTKTIIRELKIDKHDTI